MLSIGDGRFVLAIQTLVTLGRTFLSGEKPLNELELSEQLGCSSLVLKSILEDLKKGGILARGDSRDMPLILRVSPQHISLDKVRTLLLPHTSIPHHYHEIGEVFTTVGKEESKTLQDIIS